MQGPQSLTELRELLRPREYPPDVPGTPPKAVHVQTPSDRMRDKAYEIGQVLFGLVPDSEFQALVGNVLHDLCVIGEAKLCRQHEVETEHAELRTQGLRATALGAETLPEARPLKQRKPKS